MQNTENAITIDELIDELRSFHATTRNLYFDQDFKEVAKNDAENR